MVVILGVSSSHLDYTRDLILFLMRRTRIAHWLFRIYENRGCGANCCCDLIRSPQPFSRNELIPKLDCHERPGMRDDRGSRDGESTGGARRFELLFLLHRM